MRYLRSFLSVASFLLFIASYPELQGFLAIIVFFVILGGMHYVVWGRGMEAAIARAAAEGPNDVSDNYWMTEIDPVRASSRHKIDDAWPS